MLPRITPIAPIRIQVPFDDPMANFMDHLADEVLPALIDRLSTGRKSRRTD
jgi:hypothetical protein